MRYKVFTAGKLAAQACSLLMPNQFRYPQPVKGRYDVAGSKLEKLKWAYKCWVNQLEVAEKGSGLEEFFRLQKLDFALPEGFVPEATLSLTAAGDLMAVDAMDYESTPHLFDDIADFYFGADVVCANLESTVYSGAPVGRNQVTAQPPKMNTSEAMLNRFLAGGKGINYLATANNHCYDYGKEGLLATLDLLEEKGVWHSGTNRNAAEQEDVLIVEQKGIRLAMLSYTFDMNGNEYEDKSLINEVRFNDEAPDLSLAYRHIAKAKEKGADLIIATCHWGWEFEMYPHKAIVEMAHTLFKAGVDVILGGHPHVSQPMEKYEFERDGKKRTGFVVYSLGDFVSYHPLTKNSKITYVVGLQASKGTLGGEATTLLHGLQVLPVYILAEEKAEDAYDCRLLRFAHVLKDNEQGPPYRYRLSAEERADLGRLDERVLRGILLPEDVEGLVAP